jgi:distribution and morphology protein 12
LINYPSPGFMSLPLNLTLTGLAFDGTLVVAYEGGRRRVHLSILDPGAGGEGVGLGGGKETPGMRVLKSAVVESEVGQGDKHVLKNVGKVEKFVLEVARKTIESELIFPCVFLFSL